jgi:hypothetical protein
MRLGPCLTMLTLSKSSIKLRRSVRAHYILLVASHRVISSSTLNYILLFLNMYRPPVTLYAIYESLKPINLS